MNDAPGGGPEADPGSRGGPGSGVPPDPVAAKDLRRFEAYCRWSAHLALACLGLAGTAGALSLVAHTREDIGQSGLLLALAGSVGLGLLFTSGSVAACEILFRGDRLPRALAWGYLAVGVALATMSPLLTPTDGVYDDGAGRWVGTAPWVVSAFALVASLRYGWRRLLAGIGAAGALLLLAYLSAGHTMLSAGLLTSASVVYSLFFVPVGLLTWWMVDVVRRLDRSRGVAAQLAVAEERLRFSRDLHDVFGRTLSTVAVKSELGAELARRGDPRAVDEMLAVRDLAQTSLSEVRGVVRGYRGVDFGEESTGARSVLRSAGIATRIDGLDDLTSGLRPEGAEAFAWVLRESVTNVLRHAGATRVEIIGRHDDGRAVLRISNDIARRTGERAPGTGLLGLAERVEAQGGTFEAGVRGEEFVVEATLPLPAARHDATRGAETRSADAP